jgi:argininosuccinate lyase
MSNLWGGRFSGSTADVVKRLNDSFSYDCRLWRQDIQGSIAYATALKDAGILTEEEANQTIAALECLVHDIEAGTGVLDPTSEDIHSAVEAALKQQIGPLAGKLHTGRSRNDQVATDTRLYVRGAIAQIQHQTKNLQTTLVELAEREIETVMPGYTHLQHAQPILLSHHLLAYFWMLERDRTRLSEVKARVNVLPLGSGALAGSTAPLNRDMLAELLGFDAVSENSMDAVSDRDYLIEFTCACSLLATHLSRFAEEIILWNSFEFRFVDLDDSVTTGSSMMPQKKNPDVAELARAKPARINGHLVALLTLVKGLPLAYNKDLQEDKEPLFDTVDTITTLLPAFDLMLKTIRFNHDRLRAALHGDFSTATDLADYLVKEGTPFREAHEIVGRVVRHCVESETHLEDLTPEQLKSFGDGLEKAPTGSAAIQATLEAREIKGGTGPQAVRSQLSKAKACLSTTSQFAS